MRAHVLVGFTLLALLVPAGGALGQSGGGAATITTQVVESFDGEPIVSTLFLPAGASDAEPVPLVLRTHGWAGTRQTEASGTVRTLLDNGYAVLTWDSRGFGCSGGVVHVDKPGVEGRDASALIDWAVANAPIAADRTGDPRVGFTGGSYAGGIQTATASRDPRVDAIAPEISWQDLRYSLYSGGVLNQGWATLLYAAGTPTAQAQGLDPTCPAGSRGGGLDPLIHRGFAEGAATGTVSERVLDFFGASSLAVYGTDHPVNVPTLVIQGSVDTLFDLTDGHRIVEHVRAQGAPARLLVFCGGHVGCPAGYADADDGARIDAAIVAWFDRHLRGEDVDTGPPVTYRTNDGQWRAAAAFPPPDTGRLTASGGGALTSIPVVDTPGGEELAGYVDSLQSGGSVPPTPLTVAQPANAVELAAGQAITIPVAAATAGPVELLGIPSVRLEVTPVVGTEVVLFAKLVDREAGAVVNVQEGAVRVPLADGPIPGTGGPTTVDVPMPGVAYTLPAGHHLDLQLSTASLMHANARTPARVQLAVDASVPADVPPAPRPGLTSQVR